MWTELSTCLTVVANPHRSSVQHFGGLRLLCRLGAGCAEVLLHTTPPVQDGMHQSMWAADHTTQPCMRLVWWPEADEMPIMRMREQPSAILPKHSACAANLQVAVTCRDPWSARPPRHQTSHSATHNQTFSPMLASPQSGDSAAATLEGSAVTCTRRLSAQLVTRQSRLCPTTSLWGGPSPGEEVSSSA